MASLAAKKTLLAIIKGGSAVALDPKTFPACVLGVLGNNVTLNLIGISAEIGGW